MKIPQDQLDRIQGQYDWIRMRMKSIRMARGYTQTKLGELMGMTVSRVSDVELGRHDIQFSTIMRFARAVGVTLDKMFIGCPGWNSKSPSQDVVIIRKDVLVSILEEHMKSDKVGQVMECIADVERETSIG